MVFRPGVRRVRLTECKLTSFLQEHDSTRESGCAIDFLSSISVHTLRRHASEGASESIRPRTRRRWLHASSWWMKIAASAPAHEARTQGMKPKISDRPCFMATAIQAPDRPRFVNTCAIAMSDVSSIMRAIFFPPSIRTPWVFASTSPRGTRVLSPCFCVWLGFCNSDLSWARLPLLVLNRSETRGWF
jgi:hypothetical protein